MTKTKTFIFSMIPVTILLLALEIIGRIIYPFDNWKRAELTAERDHRINLPYLSGDAPAKIIIKEINGMERSYIPFLGWIGAPNIKLTTLHNNSLGFRDDPIAPRKPGETRILLLGGSVAWGLGASSNAHTIAGELQALLNQGADKTKFRVMNGAFPAWTSREEMAVLLELYEIFDPDIVIAYTGYNDIISLPDRQPEKFLLRPEAKTLAQAVEQQIKPMETSQALRKVFGSLGLWRLFIYAKEWKTVHAIPKTSTYDVDTAIQGINQVANRYHVMADYLAHHQKQLLIALQPNIYTTKKSFKNELEASIHDKWLALYDNAEAAYSEMSSRLDKAYFGLSASNVSVVDLVNVFDGISEPVFIDGCHTNDLGNYVVAEKLKKTLVEQALLGRVSVY
jgi:lysophospholipase L1-like esterase